MPIKLFTECLIFSFLLIIKKRFGDFILFSCCKENHELTSKSLSFFLNAPPAVLPGVQGVKVYGASLRVAVDELVKARQHVHLLLAPPEC